MKPYNVSSSSFGRKSYVKKEEYLLETFKRSNQDTCLTHKPAINEGTWVQSGDLLTDCASSVGGELSLGQNLLIAYMPWEGYNFEDAILISERLVMDDLYTSIHIERYELEIQKTKLGVDEITRNIPEVSEEDLASLDSFGIIKLGSWVEEGNILVGKITPINKKKISPYQKLLYTILEKQVRPIKDSSLRAPKGIKAKVIDIKYFLKSFNNFNKVVKNEISKKNKSVPSYPHSLVNTSTKPKLNTLKEGEQTPNNRINFYSKNLKRNSNLLPFTQSKNYFTQNPLIFPNGKDLAITNSQFIETKDSINFGSSKNQRSKTKSNQTKHNFKEIVKKEFLPKINFAFSKIKKNSFNIRFTYLRYLWLKSKKKYKTSFFKVDSMNSLLNSVLNVNSNSSISLFSSFSNYYSFGTFGSFVENKKGKRLISSENQMLNTNLWVFHNILKKKEFLIKNIEKIHIYLAEKRKIQVGDKMAGRHGNKGIVSQILPIEDMPYLPDGTPIDMVLNPLGVPSRMNVGQIYECLLGLSGKFLGENYKVYSFDEIYGPEASRAFVFNKLYEARSKTGLKWLFDPNTPGKIRLFDGRNGQCFDQKVTVGQAYMLRLVHMVDDKIHCLTPDHEVLTSEGWLPIIEVNLNHKVATLNKNGNLVYQNPTNVFHYDNYKGSLYHIKNKNVDLVVTLNHRMYVRKSRLNGGSFKDYKLVEAKNIIGQKCQYLKNAYWIQNDYQFMLPSVTSNSVFIPDKKVDMDSWLLFFGLWIAKGSAINNKISPCLHNVSINLDHWKNSNFSSSSKIESLLQVGLAKSHRIPLNLVDISTNLDSILVASFAGDTPSDFHYGCLNHNSYTINQKDSFLNKPIYQVQICQDKNRTYTVLDNAVNKLGYNFRIINNNITILNKQLWSYLRSLSVEASNKSLPLWVWLLSQKQARLLLLSMCFGCETWENKSLSYYTSSVKLADDIMRLALHAGWSANKYLQNPKGKVTNDNINNSLLPGKQNMWRISIIQDQNNPFVNHDYHKIQKSQKEKIFSYEGSVHCLSIPNEVFYVRRNGIPVWTGNSRSTGPYSLVTQQPLRGRSKQGGQRLGEMEVWALEGYGAAFTLLEMLTIKSDDMTGRMTLWSNLILNKDISIGTPESFKVLVCELQALCLDIGLFRNINVELNNKNSNLREITDLMNLP